MQFNSYFKDFKAIESAIARARLPVVAWPSATGWLAGLAPFKLPFFARKSVCVVPSGARSTPPPLPLTRRRRCSQFTMGAVARGEGKTDMA